MKVTVNDDLVEIEPGSSIRKLLELMEQGVSEGIALALNEHIIPQTLWEQTPLHEEDQIFIVKATQGG
ncbi:sulfur carrier protein ThiS [Deltaproteobacteria bacterium TL4]